MVLVRFKSTYLILFLCIIFQGTSCAQNSSNIKVGAEQTSQYLKLLKGKKIAVVANQTSVIKNVNKNRYTHLVDSLLSMGVSVQKVFAPEHGFRGDADAAELVKDGLDTNTGLPIVS